jgi:hypothetical protein
MGKTNERAFVVIQWKIRYAGKEGKNENTIS